MALAHVGGVLAPEIMAGAFCLHAPGLHAWPMWAIQGVGWAWELGLTDQTDQMDQTDLTDLTDPTDPTDPTDLTGMAISNAKL